MQRTRLSFPTPLALRQRYMRVVGLQTDTVMAEG